MQFDHLLWAAPDLDTGTALFAAATGIEPATGGSHPGFGTRNRLARLGEDAFFEIIAPDPAQNLAGTRGARIAAQPRPSVLTFALGTEDLEKAGAAARAAGLVVPPPVSMTRTRPDGVTLSWAILYLSHPLYGELVPFVIDWQGSPHPATTSPAGCSLKSLVVLHPEPEPLRRIYRALGIAVEVGRAPLPGFVAAVQTPRGEVTFLG